MAGGIIIAEFLEPIFDVDQGIALLRYVTDAGERSCIGIEATSLPSLQAESPSSAHSDGSPPGSHDRSGNPPHADTENR